MKNYTASPVIENEDAYYDAIARRIKANARTTRERTFHADCPDWQDILGFIEANSANKFWHDVAQGVREYGAPRPRIIEIVRERLAQTAAKKAEWKARDAQSQHIGAVGGKIEVEAVVTFRTSFESAFGWVDITGFRAGDNVIIHKGTAPKVDGAAQDQSNSYYDTATHQWIQTDFKREIAKGDRVMLKATVKEHGERDGVKQTIVTRPKTVLMPQVEG